MLQRSKKAESSCDYRAEQSPELVRRVTKEDATEPAFRNAYWDNHHPGLYVDPYTGEVLFASIHKFDSGTGWPSFYKAINYGNIECKEDHDFGMQRIEVRSKSSDSHLGHLFNDGLLAETKGTGKRYCINSAALRFVPIEDLSSSDHADYIPLFEPNPQETARDNPLFATAIFAGGCFWCTESAFEGLEGVMKVLSGYTGGNTENPTYEQVSGGGTGHYEAIQILYQPFEISYQKLLSTFWRHIDPTDGGGQFYDRGSQYYTAIFYRNETEHELAQQSKQDLQAKKVFGEKEIVTEILSEQRFYLAEDYHQDYATQNPGPYQNYVQGSGRKYFLQSVWNDRPQN